jgi:uncharacterized protein YndB with AHSA1/START domain
MTSDVVRAEILDTGSPRIRAARITIAAPARQIFDVLADPRRHREFDGSGTVLGHVDGPERLHLGARFSMSMRIRFRYRTVNTVLEFEDGRLIAWAHFNKHRWRYELEPVDDHTTVVTETFDGTTALFSPTLRLLNAYGNNEIAMAKSLVRLKRLVESA